MTTTGFTSAVAHRDDASLLMVRARDRQSLLGLARDLGRPERDVYSSLPSDYPYRLVVPRIEYAAWMQDQVMALDYENYKSAAAEQRGGKFMVFLHDVWLAGLSLTDRASREANDAAWAERERGWAEDDPFDRTPRP